MPGFDGTGPNGMGPMTGGGRGFCNPRGTGYAAFPRWNTYAYAYPQYSAYGYRPYAPRASRAQELEYLKGRAEALRSELRVLESEIEGLSAGKSKE